MRVNPSPSVAMPNVNEAAKAWESELAGRFGIAVQARRKALKMTAQRLAERTAELGYPITRVAISKIEGNMRAGKIDVAELLVLAAALDIAPVLLLAPAFPDGEVETRPGRSVDSREAAQWFAGQLPSMASADLFQTDRLLAETEKRLARTREILAQRDIGPQEAEVRREDIEHGKELLVKLRVDVAREKDELWGGASFDD